MTASCPHGEHASYCIDCMEGPPPERPTPAWTRVGDLFVARYDSLCRFCGGDVVAGITLIQRWDRGDDETAYTCQRCRP